MSNRSNFTFTAQYASQLTLRKRREDSTQRKIRTEDTLKRIFQEIRKAADTTGNPCTAVFPLTFDKDELDLDSIFTELKSCGFSVEINSSDPRDLKPTSTLVISWPDPGPVDKIED